MMLIWGFHIAQLKLYRVVHSIRNQIAYIGPSSPSNPLLALVYSIGMHITASTPLPNQHCSHRASMTRPICSLLLTSITTTGLLDFSTTPDMIKMYKAGLALQEISIGSESAQLLCAVPLAIRPVQDSAILISDSGYAIMSRTEFSATNTSFTILWIGHVGLRNVPGLILIVCAHHGLLLLEFAGPRSFGVDLNASLNFGVCSSSVKAITGSTKGVTDNGITLPAADLVQCRSDTIWWNFVGNKLWVSFRLPKVWHMFSLEFFCSRKPVPWGLCYNDVVVLNNEKADMRYVAQLGRPTPVVHFPLFAMAVSYVKMDYAPIVLTRGGLFGYYVTGLGALNGPTVITSSVSHLHAPADVMLIFAQVKSLTDQLQMLVFEYNHNVAHPQALAWCASSFPWIEVANVIQIWPH